MTLGSDAGRMFFWGTGAFVGVGERVDGGVINPIGSILMARDAKELDEVACGVTTTH